MNPFCIPMAISNMGGAMLAMDLGFMGPNYSISTACATGNYCILRWGRRWRAPPEGLGTPGQGSASLKSQGATWGTTLPCHAPSGAPPLASPCASPCPLARLNLRPSALSLCRSAADHIKRGDADLMLAGGADAAVIPSGIGGFIACKALSRRNDDPAAASRPWDQGRDGFVMGEGAGVLVMEELEHAKARGAPILAEFIGGAFTCDAHHMTEPEPAGRGVISCIQKSLAHAGIAAEQVGGGGAARAGGCCGQH